MLTLSHQTIVWTPTVGPSRRMSRKSFDGGTSLSSSYRAEPEILVGPAEVAEPLDVVDEDEDRDQVVGGIALAPDDLRGELGEGGAQVAPGDVLDGVRDDVRDLAQPAGERRIDRAAVQEVEVTRLGADRRVLRGDAHDRHDHHGQRRLVALADDQDIAAALRAEDDYRWGP